ncbi:semaphorin-4E-like [Paroedura picta]|uniref:semaphorin-4E-like n=1 Tax=Paroedura picta TaxID=143630 RepID=UPI0040577358
MKTLVFAFCLLPACGMIQLLETGSILSCMPRKTVPYQSGNLKSFWKKGLSNFSTLLVSEEANILYVGAKNVILALDLNDVSKELSRERWFSSEDRQLECLRRGKSKAECQNYILILHKINETSLYTCGTNAFLPACGYMVIDSKKLRLQGEVVESRGNCPFEPTLKHASLMVDGALYSATSNNFLGTEPIILRSLKNPLRTEFKARWLNEPAFVHLALVQDSRTSTDRIYVFFTETAIEFEYYGKVLVSRVAQICTNDLGGKRVLKNRWTSFLKSTLLCSVVELDFQFNVIQDVFMLKGTGGRETIFYGIFTQQWGKLDISAVCAFSVETIQDIFREGSYKSPLSMEHSHVKWVLHKGAVPTPRPGACIDRSGHSQGYNSSLDLPDRVLQFARDQPLLDSTVTSIDHWPVLLRRGTRYTRLVVDRAIGLDNSSYDIFFLGTDRGYLHKALSCCREMIIIEEIQLFPSPEPVQSLKLVPQKGMLYAGSASQLVQLPLETCTSYQCCFDCVLARDPYCAWSLLLRSCIAVTGQHRGLQDLIQSLSDGDASRCPAEEKKPVRYPLVLGSSLQLECTPLSNLARSVWMQNRSLLWVKEGKHLLHAGGLVIFAMAVADAGLYECQSAEKANGREFLITTAAYFLFLPPAGGLPVPKRDSFNQTLADSTVTDTGRSLALPETEDTAQPGKIQGPPLILTLLGSIFAFLFLSLLTWNVYKGHLRLPWQMRDRRPVAANPDGSATPSLGPAQLDSAQKSLAVHTVPSTISESAPLVSTSGETCSVMVSCGASLPMGPAGCHSPSHRIPAAPKEDRAM